MENKKDNQNVMYKLGIYHSDDKMSDLVCENYQTLFVLSRFNISLGFGEKSIAEVCEDNGVDTNTFLAVVNTILDPDDVGSDVVAGISPDAFLKYLHSSHEYFLDFKFPTIRKELIEALDCSETEITFAVMKFFDEYAQEVRKHMMYEENNVFPYVRRLIRGERPTDYSIEIFRKHHDSVEAKLTEFKNILIKYYPAKNSNPLNNTLFDIFTCESDLAQHNYVENTLFVPLVKRMEADE